MADEIVPSPAIEAFHGIVSLVRSIPYMRIARAVAVPLRLVAIPLSYLLEALLVILAPVIFIAQALFSLSQWIYSVLAGLKVRPSPRNTLSITSLTPSTIATI